jgi:hypothetical protein
MHHRQARRGTGAERRNDRNRQGDLRILTDGASKFRLGSGKAEAFPIRQSLASGKILLLLTDGA